VKLDLAVYNLVWLSVGSAVERSRCTAMHDARAIANFLLDYADEKKVKVKLMSLLKIIFYAHGWHLSMKKGPLIAQPFEAWEYGPVVRSVWEAFKGSGKRPLTTRAQRLDVVSNSYSEARESIGDEDAEFLRHIFNTYGHIDSFDLSAATHVPGSPWERVWNAPHGDINIGMKIPDDQILKWFSGGRAPSFLH
jgi:uncharacterized phage-associated protein